MEVHKPQKSKPIKSMSKINNNRFLNQNIYNTFLQKVLKKVSRGMANA